MNQQWQNLLQNRGEWHGSFTQFSPQGEERQDLPTIVTLKGLEDDRTIGLTVNYLTQSERNVNLTLSHLGRDVLVHANGAFSQGSMQVSPFGDFGTELGLRWENQRLRLVQRFHDRFLDQITLIRETLANTIPVHRSPVTVADVLGEWQGQAVTQFADLRSPVTLDWSSHICLENTDLQWHSPATGSGLTFRSETPQRWTAIDSAVDYQLLLLPGGAFCTCPRTVPLQQSFVLELGWQISPQRRDRLRREYDERGAWIGLTWITEHRVFP